MVCHFCQIKQHNMACHCCCQIEYDLETSSKDDLRLSSSDRIEQSAIPTFMASHPPVTKESFIVTANNQVYRVVNMKVILKYHNSKKRFYIVSTLFYKQTYIYNSMVTNQNRLSPYLGFLLYFHKSQSYTFCNYT